MGCIEVGHHHSWNTKGVLVIQQCEIYCNFCFGPKAQKPWKYAWFLRRHVRNVHQNGKNADFPLVAVSKWWKTKGNITKGKAKARRAHVKKQRASEEPEDSKVGLADQKDLPDFMPPPKIDGVDGGFMGEFDGEAARDFGYDNVVNDVLTNTKLLLGTDEVDEDDPMLSILEQTDVEVFMRRAMTGFTHPITERLTPTGDDDGNAAFQGYDGIPEEAVDELAGEFDAEDVGQTTARGRRAARKAPATTDDEMQFGGAEVRRSIEYDHTTPGGEITGTGFGWNPDNVPDQFFMSDYATPSGLPDLENRPLSDYFDMAFPAGPTENNLNMMAMLNTTTEEMRMQGMENKDMLWSMNQFARGFAEFGNPSLTTGLVLQQGECEPLVGDESFQPFN